MLLDLVQNIALLVSLAVGLQILSHKMESRRAAYRITAGLLFGLVGLVGMMTPVRYAPGIIYDGRSIVLSLAGLVGGPLAALVSALICGAYRLHLGGSAVWVGTAVILESALMGIALYYLRKENPKWVGTFRLLIFGVLVHLIMLALQLLMPGKMGWEVVRQFGPTIMLVYPLAFLLTAHVFLEGERRRADARALSQSQERYRGLFEKNHAVMLLLDPESATILDANPAAEKFYGWTLDQLRGKSITEINTLTPDEIRKEIQAAKLTQRNHFMFRHRLADGTIRDVEIYSGAIRLGEKDVLYSLVHDVSERRQAEEALRASEAFRRAMIDCSPVALYSIDPEGRVQVWNSSAEKIFGWSEEEIIGKPLPIVPESEKEGFLALMQDILEGRAFTGREVTRQKKDGSLICGRLSTASIRDGNGEIVGIMAAMEDITESKMLEEQLLQVQKMDSIGRLAGGVAHDFNNMLNVILGHSDLILDELPADNALRQDLEEIKRAAQRSADLTRQLLAFARRQTVEPKVLDLNETIESMLKMLGRLVGENIDFLWKPGTELEAIKIDPAQVDQILANLIVNARDAIGHGVGKITIETGSAEFDEAYCAIHSGFSPGRYTMLAVSDDGCGMEESTKAHIFEPFYTTKEVGEGTGLGLSTVYGIVKQNQGFINVYSEPGRGTTFRIYLSVYRAAKTEPIKNRDKASFSALGRETILLVEDEASILALAARMLDKLGYSTLTALTPGEAIALAEKHAGEINLLVTDVVMPEMNGRDLAKCLLSLYPNIKRLFMSGYTANVIAHQGVLDEGVNFIQKPFSIHELGHKVREVLDNN